MPLPRHNSVVTPGTDDRNTPRAWALRKLFRLCNVLSELWGSVRGDSNGELYAKRTEWRETPSRYNRNVGHGCEDRDGRDRGQQKIEPHQVRKGWGEGARGIPYQRRTNGDRAQGSEREVGLMPVSIESAARVVSECSGWKSTNLTLQKILYIAQVVNLGRTGKRLIDADFEAWDYGPVAPDLYRSIKGFGSKPIPQSVFWAAPDISNTPEMAILKEACGHLIHKPVGDLIRNTHWSGGAWAKNYVPGANVEITDEDMLYEYRNRTERLAAAA